MIINLPMIRRGVLRLWAGTWVEITSVAKRTWTLCPPECQRLPPAVHPPGALERIKALSPWRSWDTESLLIRGGQRQSPPTQAFLLENVDIVGACLYARASKRRLGYGPDRLLFPEAAERRHLEKAHLVSTWSGTHFFGSLLLDDFALELIAEDPAGNVSMLAKPYSHEAGYRRLLGIERTPVVRCARIRHFVMYEDPTHSSSKAARYRELRRRMRSRFSGEATTGRPGVYLRRGGGGERRLLANEAAVEAFLGERGFDVVDTASLSAEEIARRTLGAAVVVGIEGSHLSHAIFTMADDGALLVIQPSDRFAMVYKEFADCLGMRFGFLVAEEAKAGYSVSLPELAGLLELL